MPTVLAVFAHPDDMELLCAGTLKLLVDRGWTMATVTLCGGDLGSTTETREAIHARRLKEAEAGAAVVGGAYAWAGLDDFTLHYCPEQLVAVVEQLRRFAPDVVITHSPEDYLPDHEECSRLVRMACFTAGVPLYKTASPATGKPIPALYYADALEGKDLLGRPVVPMFRIDVTTTFAVRERALACHVSQREWLRSHHGIDQYLLENERLARGYGEHCGVRYAEGFRQHLGHAYPQENILGHALAGFLKADPAAIPSTPKD
ncbi:MAG: PIG-L family deacetylase [bacterium]